MALLTPQGVKEVFQFQVKREKVGPEVGVCQGSLQGSVSSGDTLSVHLSRTPPVMGAATIPGLLIPPAGGQY